MRPKEEQFFEQLYRDNFRKLNRYARVHLDPFRAEEVVQDTFHDALEKIDGLLEHENPYGWLMVTLKHKINNYQRSRQRDLLRLVSLDAVPVQELPATKSVDRLVEEKEDQIFVKERIQNTLSDCERYIVRRLIYEKATHKELSEELGITIWASQKRMGRIREKLGKYFPDRWTKK